MNKKRVFVCISVAVVILAAAAVLFALRGSRGYRDIVVFDVNGAATAVREGKKLPVAVNMKLRSGDEVRVGEEGFLRLKLDDDKYVFADEDTTLVLEATGSAKSSRTAIYVAKGSVITEVQKKLEGDSSFDIVTPNTTMAIRGTITHTMVEILTADDKQDFYHGYTRNYYAYDG